MEKFDRMYQEQKNVWGTEPSSVISQHIDLLARGTVLDAGAGDGRNAIWLAKRGFEVTAVDTAATGLANIERSAQEQGALTDIRTITADIVGFRPTESYDNIICNFTLHFLGQDNITPTLEMFAAHTKPGGINIIDDFTPNGPFGERNPENFPTPDMIENFYTSRGWEILSSDLRSVPTREFEMPGKPLMHEAIALIARKPTAQP